MKQSAICSLIFAVSSLALGCEAPSDEPSTSTLAQQKQGLTTAECATQRTQCFSRNPLFGFFTCPAQYNQCLVTASNGLPAQVTSAIKSAAECTEEALDCVADAENPVEVAVCGENEAQCVAAIVGVDLPDVVEGTAGCVDDSVACIREAKRVSDLTICGEELTVCALEQVEAVIPVEVVEVISDVNDCGQALDTCIMEAQTASALTACSEESAHCVAGSLDVTLPDLPVAEVVSCTEDAAACTLDASSLRDISECAANLTDCAADILESVDAPPQLSCEQQWTACIARNPFNFFKCAADASSCED